MFLIDVHVRPGASDNRVDGVFDGVLAVRVTAPPTNGRANDAVCREVANAFGLRPRQIALVGGATSRRKRLELDIDPAEGANLLAQLIGE
jgi:uncharacterized protein (TIGR00251 family)